MSDAVLHYSLKGGRPPADHEVLTVAADGAFTLWRSIGRASAPPSAVGSFGGTTDGAAIRAAGSGVDDSVELPLPADASTETITLRTATLIGPNAGPVPSDWAPLTELARSLLGTLTSEPVAALGLQAEPLALVHLGTASLPVDLSRATVRAVRWDGAAIVESWEAALDASDTEVGPGWSHALEVPFSGSLTVEINDLRLHDGGEWHAAALSLRVDHGMPA